jgi:group I intron endonuclease
MFSSEINNNSGIYTITNLINNKIYIGFCQNFRSRYGDHKSTLFYSKHGNEYLQRAYDKYGSENFIFEILEECNKEYLASQENYWANLLNVHNRNYGYNIQPTHPNNLKIHSERTKLKIKLSTKGVKKSEQTKEKMSLGMKGKLKSLEHRKNLSKARKGSKMSEITRIAILKANTNRKQSLETINKRAIKKNKSIIQMDKQNNFIKIWDSIKNAAMELNICKTHIGSCCLNKRNTCGGYKWRYNKDA